MTNQRNDDWGQAQIVSKEVTRTVATQLWRAVLATADALTDPQWRKFFTAVERDVGIGRDPLEECNYVVVDAIAKVLYCEGICFQEDATLYAHIRYEGAKVFFAADNVSGMRLWIDDLVQKSIREHHFSPEVGALAALNLHRNMCSLLHPPITKLVALD